MKTDWAGCAGGCLTLVAITICLGAFVVLGGWLFGIGLRWAGL